MLGYRRDIETQRQILWKILSENIVLHQVIKEVQTFGYDNAYVGAGCICQSVWNYQNGYDPMYGISDIDIVYFDTDLSYEKEDCVKIYRLKGVSETVTWGNMQEVSDDEMIFI